MSINHDVQVHSPTPARLYKSSSSSSCSGWKIHNRYSCSGDLSLSASVCCFLSHFHRLHHAHSTGESRGSGTSPCCWDPAQDRWVIRFFGSVFMRLLAPIRLLPLRWLQVNDYFIYSWSALRSSACIGYVWLHQLRSLTMGDKGKSGDAVTQSSTGYSLKPIFMFISCIIMNIVMFNCCLNIHTCTWIVSLTVTLKCLLNYGIKIYQNIAYHLTIQKP
jgi:hypothetical protein